MHRNLIQPAFRGSELTEKFVPVIAGNARDLVDPWRNEGASTSSGSSRSSSRST